MGILNAFLLNFTNAFMSSASSILASKFSLISFRKYGDTLSMFSFFYLKKIVFYLKKRKKEEKKLLLILSLEVKVEKVNKGVDFLTLSGF